MTLITTDFGLTGAVEFLDVHVERDNLLYLDPSAIRVAARKGDKYGVAADAELTVFFDDILRRLNSTIPSERQEGEKRLQNFREIPGTRLGMSRLGTDGHGAARELGTRIWNELFANPLCRQAIATLKYVEDIPLFVGGIDKDITSDIAARIILRTLGAFTEDMMAKHPEFAARRPPVAVAVTCWSNHNLSWQTETFTVPVADGKPLVLVPKRFANYKLQMAYRHYYQVPLLDYIKWEDTVKVVRRRKETLKPRYSKDVLKLMPGLSKSRKTSIDQTARIFEKDRTDILGDYRADRQAQFDELSDAKILEYVDRVPK